MFKLAKLELSATEISREMNGALEGSDIVICGISPIDNVVPFTITVCYKKFSEKLHKINVPCIVVCDVDTKVNNQYISYILVETPRKSFFGWLWNHVEETDYWLNHRISEASDLFPGVQFGFDVRLGKNVQIAPETQIGSNCTIGSNVVIRSGVTLGSNCVIKDNTVIGTEGFGFVDDNDGLIHIPQLGKIKIGDNVFIGSMVAIERPAMGETVIANDVKIDDLVQIGHNVQIGEGTLITTGFKAVGGAKIGKKCFIGMGSTVVNKDATIGDGAIIGAGAVILKPVASGETVYTKVINETSNKNTYSKILSGGKA